MCNKICMIFTHSLYKMFSVFFATTPTVYSLQLIRVVSI